MGEANGMAAGMFGAAGGTKKKRKSPDRLTYADIGKLTAAMQRLDNQIKAEQPAAAMALRWLQAESGVKISEQQMRTLVTECGYAWTFVRVVNRGKSGVHHAAVAKAARLVMESLGVDVPAELTAAIEYFERQAQKDKPTKTTVSAA